MKLGLHIAIVACVTTGVWLSPATPAAACSAPICWPETFAPSWNGTMPVNLQALWWAPGRDGNGNATDVSDLQLACTSAAGDVRSLQVHAGTTGVLLIDDVFAVGDQCEITTYCDNPYDDRDAGSEDLSTQTRFMVTEPADPPRALPLVASAATWHYAEGPYDDSGDCFAPGTYDCAGAVTADLRAEDIAPWADVLAFDALGNDGAFHAIEGFGVALAPGTHTVTLRARLPDGSLALESEPHTFTIEPCTTPQPMVDAGDDGGPSTIDAGMSAPADDAGCGCQTVGRGHTSSLTWFVLMMIGAFAVRRVRASRVAWRARARRG